MGSRNAKDLRGVKNPLDRRRYFNSVMDSLVQEYARMYPLFATKTLQVGLPFFCTIRATGLSRQDGWEAFDCVWRVF